MIITTTTAAAPKTTTTTTTNHSIISNNEEEDDYSNILQESLLWIWIALGFYILLFLMVLIFLVMQLRASWRRYRERIDQDQDSTTKKRRFSPPSSRLTFHLLLTVSVAGRITFFALFIAPPTRHVFDRRTELAALFPDLISLFFYLVYFRVICYWAKVYLQLAASTKSSTVATSSATPKSSSRTVFGYYYYYSSSSSRTFEKTSLQSQQQQQQQQQVSSISGRHANASILSSINRQNSSFFYRSPTATTATTTTSNNTSGSSEASSVSSGGDESASDYNTPLLAAAAQNHHHRHHHHHHPIAISAPSTSSSSSPSSSSTTTTTTTTWSSYSGVGIRRGFWVTFVVCFLYIVIANLTSVALRKPDIYAYAVSIPFFPLGSVLNGLGFFYFGLRLCIVLGRLGAQRQRAFAYMIQIGIVAGISVVSFFVRAVIVLLLNTYPSLFGSLMSQAEFGFLLFAFWMALEWFPSCVVLVAFNTIIKKRKQQQHQVRRRNNSYSYHL